MWVRASSPTRRACGPAATGSRRLPRRSPEFPLVLMLRDGHAAPGLPFLRQLHWIVSADPTSEKDVARLIDATAGARARPAELWRYTSPYRGLSAMEEKD